MIELCFYDRYHKLLFVLIPSSNLRQSSLSKGGAYLAKKKVSIVK